MAVKLGATAAGGAIGGALFVSTNYMNTIAQKQAESKSGNKSSSDHNSFSAKSMSENYNSDTDYLDAVIGLLDTNLLLHFCILYLLICLPVLYITTNISTDKLNINFIKNTFGINTHNLIVKLLKYVSKTNKIWRVIIWILLIIACLGTIYISYFISLNIDTISEIYQNNKK